MITYINSKNAYDYHVLFNKAADFLKSKSDQLTDLTTTLEQYNMNWDNFSIGTLNEYFAYLKKLTDLAETDDEKAFYLRLPLDEDTFDINADTRAISVPASFAENGVGVQGDEMAEIVYFTIDRYFDSTDLANDEIHIAIQWEAKNINGETIQGFTRNFGKDIETKADSQKIIFGWPISSEFTKAPGTIRFAVRFYRYNDNQEFIYSLTTLPATVRINASLDYDVINNAQMEIDHGKVLTSRVVSSGIYNPSLPTPSAPKVTKELYVASPAGKETYKIVDIPPYQEVDQDNDTFDSTKQYFIKESDKYVPVDISSFDEETTYYTNQGITLAIGAQPSDIGIVGCDWKYFAYIDGLYNTSSSPLSIAENKQFPSIKEDYIEVTEDIEDLEKFYYIKGSEEGQYSKFNDIDRLQLIDDIAIYEDDLGFETIDNSYVKLYEKIFTATVNKVGIYTADVYSLALVNSVPKTMNRADGITIPGPQKPFIDLTAFDSQEDSNILVNDSDKSIHIVVTDDNASSVDLTVHAISGEEHINDPAITGVGPVVNLTYDWEKKVNNEWVDLNHKEDTFTVNNLDMNERFDEEYRAIVTSTRNGESTQAESGIYRLTPAPVAPSIRVKRTTLSQNGIVTSWDNISYNPSAPGENELTVSLNTPLEIRVDPNLQTDKLSYLWMYYETPRAIDLTDTEASNALLEEIETKLSKIFGNPWEDRDEIIQDLTAFSSLETIDDTEVYTSSYTPTSVSNGGRGTGYYYCVVINELNQHINATATPLFHVYVNQ